MKIVILVLLLMIIISLFVALYTLVNDRGRSTRTLRALTMRVSLSVLLIIILLISYKAGLIKPNTSPFNYVLKSDVPKKQ